MIDFIYESGLFIEEKQVFTKKNRRSAGCRDFMAVQMKNFVLPLFEKSKNPFKSVLLDH
jgi:hypothetical protein